MYDYGGEIRFYVRSLLPVTGLITQSPTTLPILAI